MDIYMIVLWQEGLWTYGCMHGEGIVLLLCVLSLPFVRMIISPLYTPVPALFSATTDTVYSVNGVSPDIVASLALHHHHTRPDLREGIFPL